VGASGLREAHEKIRAAVSWSQEDGVLRIAARRQACFKSSTGSGNAAWSAMESGVERATTTRDDVWYKPYDHAADYLKHARDYLDWEVALVEQIKKDPTIRFRVYS
jgi:hypothetical protein